MSRRASAIVLACAALLACTGEAVEWDAISTLAAGVDLVGPATPVPPTDPTHVAPESLGPPDVPGEHRCVGSLRGVRDSASLRVAVWWSARADSTTRLVAALSTDAGATWAAPVPVDSLDRGARGCARPAPAVAYDPAGGYVHVAYFLDAPEGSGLFFAHSMDDGAMFHAPVPIVYGERPVVASVDAQRDTVAVAYENPNSREPQVSLALSRTAGHIFEDKAIVVSPGTFPATAPSVHVDGRRIDVQWWERQGGQPVLRRRVGTLR